MKSLLILIPLLLVSYTFADFICERFQRAKLQNTNEVFTCFMGILKGDKPKTRFPTSTFSSAAGVTFQGSKNINELPERISKALINLENYDATACAVRTIGKNNFINLKKLKRVWLSNNEIDTVDSDTFDDNTLLAEIALDNNKLKVMSGQVFQNLRSLQKVTLSGNLCVNQNFDTSSKIQELPQTVSRLCKFCEPASDPTELADCQSNLLITSDKLRKCNTDLETQTTTTPASTDASNSLCKILLDNQKSSFDPVILLHTNAIEDLKKEKQKLVIENDKLRKSISVCDKQILTLRQNCGQPATASSDDYTAFNQ